MTKQKGKKHPNYFKTHFNHLIKYCEARGYAVKLGNESIVSFEDREITVNRALIYENKVYALLHEIGHIICLKSKYYNEKYPPPIQVYDAENDILKSNTHKVLALAEEFEAWHLGFLLAKRLKIEINNTRFDTIKARWLKTYIDAFWNK
jgi:hypothetical protein